MKPDRGLLKTVLFALGVVSFVIGVYQTIVFNDLQANYWIFMVSMCCWLPLRYWRQKEALAAKEAAQAAAPATRTAPTAGQPNKGSQSRRKRR